MSKKEKPRTWHTEVNSIRRILSPALTREDFAMTMKHLSTLTKPYRFNGKFEDTDWKFYYKAIKMILASRLKQETYAQVVKYLNVLVRPYRENQ